MCKCTPDGMYTHAFTVTCSKQLRAAPRRKRQTSPKHKSGNAEWKKVQSIGVWPNKRLGVVGLFLAIKEENKTTYTGWNFRNYYFILWEIVTETRLATPPLTCFTCTYTHTPLTAKAITSFSHELQTIPEKSSIHFIHFPSLLVVHSVSPRRRSLLGEPSRQFISHHDFKSLPCSNHMTFDSKNTYGFSSINSHWHSHVHEQRVHWYVGGSTASPRVAQHPDLWPAAMKLMQDQVGHQKNGNGIRLSFLTRLWPEQDGSINLSLCLVIAEANVATTKNEKLTFVCKWLKIIVIVGKCNQCGNQTVYISPQIPF